MLYKLPALLAGMGKRAAMAKPAMLLLLVGAHALLPTPKTRHPTRLHSTKQDNVVETAGRAGFAVRRGPVAAAAVNQAVSMTTLDAPDVGRSYVALRDDKDGATDARGEALPLSYDKDHPAVLAQAKVRPCSAGASSSD